MRLAIGTITIVTGLALALGLTMLHSIGMHHPMGMYFFNQQCRWLAIGLVACVLAMAVDYRSTRAPAYVLLVAAAVLLVLARAIGVEIKGAWRWLRVGPISVQPSEIAKLALILAIAAYAHACRRRMSNFVYGLALPGAAIGVVLFLVLLGKDLGTTALLAMLSAAMLFAAGARLRHLIPIGILGAIALGAYLATDPVRWRRVDAFLHPEKYAQTIALQSEQSKVAIGSGGAFGRGLGNGVQKAGFVPEQPGDFIFSVIGEELGLQVTLPLLGAYVAFALAALSIARRAADMYGSMIAFGVAMLVALQAIINVAVTTGSMPNKGLALPFVSYGGSCLVVMLTLVGLLINVGLRSARDESAGLVPNDPDREAAGLQPA
jgi:cell division protein FtsW